MLNLKQIDDFGGTAAEDDNIKKFFLRTEAFDRIVEGKRHVVIGRKGSGKTALYLALQDDCDRNGQLVAPLRFSDYPWQAHYNFTNPSVDRAERFVESWRFLILVEAISRILGECESPRRVVCELKDFLRENYGTLDFSYKEVFQRRKFTFKGISFAPEVMGNSLGSVEAEASPRASGLGETLGRVNAWLWERLVQLKDYPACYVLFDELDLGWDPTNEDYKHRLIGLLVAVRRFVSSAKAAVVDVRPVVFLRSDIFETLSFGDKNKIWTGDTEELRWHDRMDYGGASLKHLIDFRIRESLDLPAEIDDPWEYVYDDQVMAGTQHKFQHMTFRSLLRPRDVIQFCNLSLSAYQNRIRYSVASVEDQKIRNTDVKEARRDYSEYFRRELDDEIAEAHPEWQQCLEVLRFVGHSKFTGDEFQRAFSNVAAGRNLNYTADEMLSLLYEYSIVGFLRKSLDGSGMAFHFRYQDESINLDPGAKKFAVHRALKEALGLSQIPGGEGYEEEPLF